MLVSHFNPQLIILIQKHFFLWGTSCSFIPVEQAWDYCMKFTIPTLSANLKCQSYRISHSNACVMSEVYRPRDRRLSAKLVTTFADRGCRVVSMTYPYGQILGFLDWSNYYYFQVAPQLYSQIWVDPIQDPLLLRKSGSTRNRTRTSRSVARNPVH
jgi:hypothetical protein